MSELVGLVVAGVAAWKDYRTRRAPGAVLLLLAVGGALAMMTTPTDAYRVATALVVFVTLVVAGFPGGDTKTAATVTLFLDPAHALGAVALALAITLVLWRWRGPGGRPWLVIYVTALVVVLVPSLFPMGRQWLMLSFPP